MRHLPTWLRPLHDAPLANVADVLDVQDAPPANVAASAQADVHDAPIANVDVFELQVGVQDAPLANVAASAQADVQDAPLANIAAPASQMCKMRHLPT